MSQFSMRQKGTSAMNTAKFNLQSGPGQRQAVSGKALCAYMHAHICRVGVS